jgi:hypothetical protein
VEWLVTERLVPAVQQGDGEGFTQAVKGVSTRGTMFEGPSKEKGGENMDEGQCSSDESNHFLRCGNRDPWSAIEVSRVTY